MAGGAEACFWSDTAGLSSAKVEGFRPHRKMLQVTPRRNLEKCQPAIICVSSNHVMKESMQGLDAILFLRKHKTVLGKPIVTRISSASMESPPRANLHEHQQDIFG